MVWSMAGRRLGMAWAVFFFFIICINGIYISHRCFAIRSRSTGRIIYMDWTGLDGVGAGLGMVMVMGGRGGRTGWLVGRLGSSHNRIRLMMMEHELLDVS
ncbi:hypothetical protein B0T22DRAFT_32478 [Podospora appendiculata]|uniref:Uncharacterized protein n=1 Tax=Podospora appendiculata TaxID=314037 RepID=A0AAE0XGJ7_9PEZI|nr:hypothetical protein B0T22DRAFT_32478 [Podospora appendiculata]